MSLFSRLLKLHNGNTPLEDFFTELVAHLFRTNREILHAWLKYLDLLDKDADFDAYISTQQTFERLSHHFSDSRPDIIIELIDGSNRDIIFIESKIGSQEGCNQLKRYAEILDKLSGFRHKHLIYITRDFEIKEIKTIFCEIPKSNVYFKQARWHEFHQFLNTQPLIAIRKFFMDSLDKLSKIKAEYSDLPWDAIKNGGGSSEWIG